MSNRFFAQQGSDAISLNRAYGIQFTVHYATGDLIAASEKFSQYSRLAQESPDIRRQPGYSIALAQSAVMLYLIGYAEQARRRMAETLEVARNRSKFDLAHALALEGLLNWWLREFKRSEAAAAREALHKLIDSCTREASERWMWRCGDGWSADVCVNGVEHER